MMSSHRCSQDGYFHRSCRSQWTIWLVISFNVSMPLCILAMLLVLPGCGRDAGPARYDLSGSITYAGKPVPSGYIVFAPDVSKGNNGPGADAEIKDGVYKVRAKEGTVGGPHIATINGFDGVGFQKGLTSNPMGLPTFSDVQISVDLPKETSKYDIAIPAQTQ
jgi:hypothetical protein